ncbi:toll/interleukin-1 receptor domain-containing protein, partial [Roseomonas sp. HJA6]
MPHDVFLSYASPDRAAADAVCAALESRGIRCWIAPRDVPAGADWGEAILTAIGRAHAMVLILSRSTANSVHVRNEVVTAVSQSLALVPVRIEDCQPGGALRLHLAGAHWLNIFPPPFAQHVDALVAGVRLALAADATIEIPRAQAAALVAAARASHAAAHGRPAGPPPGGGQLAMSPPRHAGPPPDAPGRAAPMLAAAAAPRAAAPARQAASPAPSSKRPALILALLAVLLLTALGAAAWVFEPRLRALLGAAAMLPVATGVTSAVAAPPPDEPRGLGSSATLPGLGGPLMLPPSPTAPAADSSPRSLAPATVLPGLGGSVALPPAAVTPAVPAPFAPALRPAPAP